MTMPKKFITQNSIPEYIREFINVVYPNNPELALDAFSEKECIESATHVIKDLRRKIDNHYKEMEEVIRQRNIE